MYSALIQLIFTLSKLGLSINLQKTKAMKFGSYTIPYKIILFNPIKNDCRMIKRSSEIKDLGLYLSNSHRYNKQINEIVERAKSRWYMVKRVILSKEVQLKLYNSWILPLMEFGCTIWNPLQKLLSDEIESVQKMVLRSILPFEAGYSERLVHLDMTPLWVCRIAYCICFFINNRLNNVDMSTSNKHSTRSKEFSSVILPHFNNVSSKYISYSKIYTIYNKLCKNLPKLKYMRVSQITVLLKHLYDPEIVFSQSNKIMNL